MLEKVLSFLKVLGSKAALRIALAVFTAISATAGFLIIDRSPVVYKDSVHLIDTALGSVQDVLDSTGIATTEDETEKTEVEDAVGEDTAVEAEAVKNELGLSVSGGNAYAHEPITVVTETQTETVAVKYGYKKVYSDKLYKGETKTSKGTVGEKKITYTVTLVNGIEVSREAVSEEITKEPVDQIETVGTKLNAANAVMTSDDVDCISTLKPKNPIELDKNGVPVSYSKVITGKSSAYCGRCDSNSTAYFGANSARPGYVAVNPKQIPYGTKLYIVSTDGKHVYGYAIAADTGGFAHNGSNRVVDLRMPTGTKCNCGSIWGLKNVNIYILE